MSVKPLQIYRDDPEATPDTSPLWLAHTPPPWRKFGDRREEPPATRPTLEARIMAKDQIEKGRRYVPDAKEAELVNAALVLRRPLLITGQAGLGKSTLAYSVAWQLGLGNVLRWGITSRSTLKDALYSYDAIARLQDAALHKKQRGQRALPDLGAYFTLGPLGSALLPTEAPTYFPRVLLIDEIDKSDADLPSDLLHVLEEGSFLIPEIERIPAAQKGATVSVNSADPAEGKVPVPADGRIQCNDFPLIMMTSNGDRDFPPAFLRRCLQVVIPWERREKQLNAIIRQNLGITPEEDPHVAKLLDQFNTTRMKTGSNLAIDQLLNAIFLARSSASVSPLDHESIKTAVFRSLAETPQAGTP